MVRNFQQTISFPSKPTLRHLWKMGPLEENLIASAIAAASGKKKTIAHKLNTISKIRFIFASISYSHIFVIMHENFSFPWDNGGRAEMKSPVFSCSWGINFFFS